MDISMGQPMSDIHTWIYPRIYPWISIPTATLPIWEATTAKRMKIDPHCQRQNCCALKALFNDV